MDRRRQYFLAAGLLVSFYILAFSGFAGPRGTIYILDGFGTDSDRDGLPDAWESGHGHDPGDPGDAGLDFDGDGLSALREFRMGLDPWNIDTDGDLIPDGEDLDAIPPETIPRSEDAENVCGLVVFSPPGT